MKILIPKGNFGYIKRKHILEVVKTLVYFAVSLSLYIAGIAATGSNKNLLTIVAVLGCLPASKSMVSMIMFLRFKGCSEAVYKKVNHSYQNLYGLFDMVFTSYDKNFEIDHMAVNDKVICAYSEKEKLDEKAFEKHLTEMLTQNGLKNTTVKVFRDITKYQNRLEQLEELSELGKTAEAVRTLMLEISL